jgi:hypothetical protein
MEIWKTIKGFEDYQISNIGNIKSLKFGRELLLKQNKNTKGYLCVGLQKNNIRFSKRIHQLVAENFLNHKPCGMIKVVDHINNIKTDNSVNNLRIISNRENSSKRLKKYSSIYTGVYWHKKAKKWCSIIQINKKNIYLGLFITEIDAYNKYQKVLKNN